MTTRSGPGFRAGLPGSGHVVDWLKSGRDALVAATTHEYDVLVLDRMVPELDGLSVLKAPRAAKIGTPALILTALGDVDDRVEGLRSGADDYLRKPFAFTELEAQSHRRKLTPDDRAAGMSMGADLERAWQHEAAPPELRRRILRAALVEIVVTVADNVVRLVLHWQGGSHTELRVRKNRPGEHRMVAGTETVELVRELARVLPDRLIAGFLNRAGKKTGQGNTWRQGRLKAFRSTHGIPVYRQGEMRDRNEMTQAEAAAFLSVNGPNPT